jgi:TIR domain/NB-ARC domain
MIEIGSEKMSNNAYDASTRKLRVFLCHASEDKPIVRNIYQKLKHYNIEPWLDEKDLLPGENWEQVIPDVIRKCDIVLICLSRFFLVKEGYGHYEIHVVLEAAKRKPPNTIYHIPFRLDDCEMPSYLAGIHYVSHFIPEDFDKLIAACEKRLEWLNAKHGANLEPLRNQVFEHNLGLSVPPGSVSDRMSSQLGLSNSDTAKFPARSHKVSFGAPFPDVWNVPRRHNAFFTGRASVLQQLADGFQVENGIEAAPPQAIIGLAGMGKTQIAAEYAYRFRENYRTVLWVRAQVQESLIPDFQTIASLLKLTQEHLDDPEILMQTLQKWFRDEKDWLIIFDNADDFALVAPYIPIGSGHVLLTTRVGGTVELAQPLELRSLNVEDGALSLLRRAGLLRWNQLLKDTSTEHANAARELAQQMNGLPLALEQAGAYINDTKCGVIKYLEHYERYRTKLQNLQSGMVPDYAIPVAPALMMSSLMIGRTSMAFALLQLCAFLAPEGIPDAFVVLTAPVLGELLSQMADNPILLDQTIRPLVRYSLLEREEQSGTALTTLSIHRILQLVLLDEMDIPTRQLWAERAVRALLLAQQTMAWSVLQVHIQQCLDHIALWKLSVPEAEILQTESKETT